VDSTLTSFGLKRLILDKLKSLEKRVCFMCSFQNARSRITRRLTCRKCEVKKGFREVRKLIYQTYHLRFKQKR